MEYWKEIKEEMEFLRNHGKSVFFLPTSWIRQRPATGPDPNHPRRPWVLNGHYDIIVTVPSDVSSDNHAIVKVNRQQVQFVREGSEFVEDPWGIDKPHWEKCIQYQYDWWHNEWGRLSDIDGDDKYGAIHDDSRVFRIHEYGSASVAWFNKDGPVTVRVCDADGNFQSVKMTASDIIKSHDKFVEERHIEMREQELREREQESRKKNVDAEFGDIQSDEVTSNTPQITED